VSSVQREGFSVADLDLRAILGETMHSIAESLGIDVQEEIAGAKLQVFYTLLICTNTTTFTCLAKKKLCQLDACMYPSCALCAMTAVYSEEDGDGAGCGPAAPGQRERPPVRSPAQRRGQSRSACRQRTRLYHVCTSDVCSRWGVRC
jgi:hypothetical protein